jgi:Flp pilus assembly protein TadD
MSAAIEQNKKTIELDPNYLPAHLLLGWVYLKQGRNDLAFAELEKSVELSHRHAQAVSGLGNAYAVTGKRNEALAILKELEERYARREALGIDLARVCFLPVITSGPVFQPLHSDPRFADLLRRMKLPQ